MEPQDDKDGEVEKKASEEEPGDIVEMGENETEGKEMEDGDDKGTIEEKDREKSGMSRKILGSARPRLKRGTSSVFCTAALYQWCCERKMMVIWYLWARHMFMGRWMAR